MDVPKYIKRAIEQNAIYAQKAEENNKLIRDWLEKKGIYVGEGMSVNEHEIVIDMLIDSVELSHNANEFITFLQSYELD